MRINKFIASTVLAVGAVAASPAAAAVNVGDTVSCAIIGNGGFSCSQPTATVGAGTEFTIGFSPGPQYIGVDFALNVLTISALQSSRLGTTILNLRDLTNAFSSVSLVSNNGFGGFDAAGTTVRNGNLQIDLRGTDFQNGSTLTFAVDATPAVPEPATWAMMILGMGAIGFAMRRQKGTTRVSYAA